MKKYTNNVLPLAALVLFGACGISAVGIFVIFMESFGIGGGLSFYYFQRLNLPILSVALPIVGILLFSAVLIGLSDEDEKLISPSLGEIPVKAEAKREEIHLKAA